MLRDKKSEARAAFLEMIGRRKFSLTENPMVINHTDLDSVLSSLIGTGVLSADELAYGTRAIYADHTGETDELTDLLMAVDPERDFELSLDVINRWQHGEEQTPLVQELYKKRLEQREIAQNLAKIMKDIGNGVYYAQLTGRIRFSGDLLVPGQPEATALVLAQPINPETKIPGGVDPGNFEVKIRAGMQFPEGASLLHVPFPPEWNVNGRFNAMNTTRAGGFPHRDAKTGAENDPIVVAEAIREYLASSYT